MLTASRSHAGDLELSPSNGWGTVETSDVLFTRFQQGALSASVLCAQLLIASAMQADSSDPLVIE
jgi:hypothetical protein